MVMSKKRIVNIGSLNYDHVYEVDHFVKPGETKSSLSMNTFCGGKGLNQSVALAQAGIPIYHAGAIGEDGEMMTAFLKEKGVDITYIKQVEGKTGHAMIQVDEQGENCILLYGGANQKITKDYIDLVLDNFREGDYVVLQNEISHLDYIVEQASKRKLFIVLNPSPYNQRALNCGLEKVSMLFINEIEGREITSKEEPYDMIRRIQEIYPKMRVILTLGEQGVLYAEKKQIWKQEALKVDVIDTTAAGDTFTGYFLAGMLGELTIQENLERSARASSLAIAKEGAAASIPSREQVDSEK